MGQDESKRDYLDGEIRQYNCIDSRKKSARSSKFENRSYEKKVSTHCDDNSNTIEVAVSHLPELISDILSRLPIEDVMRYRCVCKSWYALTKDPHFINMHLSRSLCSSQRLILEPRVDGPITSLYLIDTDGGMWRGRKLPVENIPGNYMFTLCSCQGLLCVDSSVIKLDPLIIYNPITRERRLLPHTDFEPDITVISVGFGFDPIGKKYKVVRFFKVFVDDDPDFYIKGQIITLGEGSWRELKVSHTVLFSSNANPVFLNGTLHWVIDIWHHPGCELILALDLSNEKFSTIKFPSSVIEAIYNPEDVFLYDLRGSLSVVEYDSWKDFRLWRIERSNNKKGYKFYQSSYFMNVRYAGFLCRRKLVDRVNDNCFLFHVIVDLNLRDMNKEKDQLLMFFSEKDEYKAVQMSGIPKYFLPMLFVHHSCHHVMIICKSVHEGTCF